MTCNEKELKQIKECSFREIYKKFVYVRCPELIESQNDVFNFSDKDDGIFGLGYIDHEAGLSIRILTPAHIENNELIIGNENNEVMNILRMDAIEEDNFYTLNLDEIDIKKYMDYLEVAMSYEEGCQGAVELRDIDVLDQFRHQYFPDDVEIFFVGEKIQTENMWLRLTKLENKSFYGTLLDEPHQKLGFHIGDEISFDIHQLQDGSLHALHICE